MNPFQYSKIKVLHVIWLLLLIPIASAFVRQTGGLNFSTYDVINAVNSLRISQGKPALQINGTLMAVAQAHSDYQASISRSSHAGAGGGIVTDRVAASGYSGGGGFVAGENVASLTIGMDNSVSIIVNEIWADSGHRGAMLNPKYTDIGVGVACDDSMVYVTLNVAGLTEPQPTILSPQVNGSSASPPPVLARVTSTPLPDGTVYHVVGYGQTLGTIAGMYGVSIQDVVNHNGIDPDKIYAGQKLWIKTVTVPVVSPTAVIITTAAPTATVLPTETQSPTGTSTPKPGKDQPINTHEAGITVLFVLLAGLVAYLLYKWIKSRIQVEG